MGSGYKYLLYTVILLYIVILLTGYSKKSFGYRCLRACMVDDQYRGLLTEREREILQDEADVSENYRYRVVSRIRTKIENIDDDIDILSNSREDVLEELREVVCNGED